MSIQGAPIAPNAWRSTGIIFSGALAALLIANHEALWSWVKLWLFSGQEYGLVVWIAGLWLYWRCRSDLRQLTPQPDWRALLAVLPIACGVWFAYLVDLRILQFALLVAAIGATIWAVLGPAALRLLAFPTAFLLLALPIGNYLEPQLQALTVRATVFGLQATGLPVYVDETYIHTPRGAIVVLERCSGAQFFQAGLTIGALYAYLNFRLLWLRLLAFAAFVVAAIVGNWIRVYALCFLGVLSDRQHFLFGWAVFIAVLVPTFWLCARWERREDRLLARSAANDRHPEASPIVRTSASIASVVGIAAVTTFLLVAGPMAGSSSNASVPINVEQVDPIDVQPPWSGPVVPPAGWRPFFGGADAEALAAYHAGDREVIGYWAYYKTQRQGAEVINELNTVYDRARWQPRGGYAGTDYLEIALADGTVLSVIETRLENLESGAVRVAWHWYRVGGTEVVRPWQAKVAQAVGRIRGRPDATAIVLSTETADLREARQLLRSFLTANSSALRATPPTGKERLTSVDKRAGQ